MAILRGPDPTVSATGGTVHKPRAAAVRWPPPFLFRGAAILLRHRSGVTSDAVLRAVLVRLRSLLVEGHG